MPLKTINSSGIKVYATEGIKTEEIALKTVDPETYMSKKDAKMWRKLSTKRKEAVLRKAQVEYFKKQSQKQPEEGKKNLKKGSGLVVKEGNAKIPKVEASQVTTVATDITKKATSMVSQEMRQEEIQAERRQAEGINQAIAKEFSTVKRSVTTPVNAIISVVPGLKATTTIMAPVLIAVVLVIILIATSVSSLVVAVAANENSSGGKRIVQVALQEEQEGPHVGGDKYWSYMGFTSRVEWCASFVSYCANECGFIDSGLFPKSASVSAYMEFYQNKGLYQEKGNYNPKEGDLIIFKNGMSHIGVVQYVEGNQVVTIEGNTSDMIHARSYPLDYYGISGYCTPAYPSGEIIEIPEPYGTNYTYMGWQMITSPSSAQFKLRQEAGQTFDSDGFGKIGDCYVIACTTKYGQVGDYIDWELANGEIIPTVIGDIKNQNDSNCNEWGHDQGATVVEFVVDKTSWYGSSNTPTMFHSEWNARVVKAYKVGSYW